MYICVYICIYVYIYMYMYIHMYMCMHFCFYVRITDYTRITILTDCRISDYFRGRENLGQPPPENKKNIDPTVFKEGPIYARI